jgi:hypothetical protein
MNAKEQAVERVSDEILEENSSEDLLDSMAIICSLREIGMPACRRTVAMLRLTADHIERGLNAVDACETKQ